MGNEASHQLKFGESLENDIKVNWKKYDVPTEFSEREGHCSCTVGNCLYVFGGVTLSETNGPESNDLLIFNTEKEEWTVVKGNAESPIPRSAATIAAVDKHLYVFGGLSREVGWLCDIHRFDTVSSKWTKLTPEGTPPSPRDKLASVVISDKIYLFGGFGPQTDIEEELEDEEDDEDEPEQEAAHFGWFNDLFCFDTKSNSWSNPMQMNLGVPTPRAAHAMCAVEKYIIIFGGRDSEARRNDIHIFDTETRKWVTELDKVVSGRQPEPRSFHTATTVGDRVVIFGGRGISNQHFSDFHIFDTKTREWLQPQIEGNVPEGRGLHTATVVDGKLMVFGGSSNFNSETMHCHRYYNDLYYIDVADVKTGKSMTKSNTENQENIPINENILNKSAKEGVKAENVLTNTSAMETTN